MMEINHITSPWAAFVFGLLTSPHCILMCGPLALMLWNKSPTVSKFERGLTLFCYHFARCASFTIFGFLFGWLGFHFLSFFQLPIAQVFPWTLVAFLLIFALGLERLVPKPLFLQKFFYKLTPKFLKLRKPIAALILGLFTPFLPCGPLYGILWLALTSGSSLFGAAILGAFALGTVPLMLFAQWQLVYWMRFITPQKLYLLQRLLALIIAIFIIYRLLAVKAPLDINCCC